MDYWAFLTLVAAAWLLYQGINAFMTMGWTGSTNVNLVNTGNTAVGGLLVFHFLAQMWSAYRAPPVPAPTLANTILGAARRVMRW
jgi:hypothetical protein